MAKIVIIYAHLNNVYTLSIHDSKNVYATCVQNMGHNVAQIKDFFNTINVY
jgi:hypothetical protein